MTRWLLGGYHWWVEALNVARHLLECSSQAFDVFSQCAMLSVCHARILAYSGCPLRIFWAYPNLLVWESLAWELKYWCRHPHHHPHLRLHGSHSSYQVQILLQGWSLLQDHHHHLHLSRLLSLLLQCCTWGCLLLKCILKCVQRHQYRHVFERLSDATTSHYPGLSSNPSTQCYCVVVVMNKVQMCWGSYKMDSIMEVEPEDQGPPRATSSTATSRRSTSLASVGKWGAWCWCWCFRPTLLHCHVTTEPCIELS